MPLLVSGARFGGVPRLGGVARLGGVVLRDPYTDFPDPNLDCPCWRRGFFGQEKNEKSETTRSLNCFTVNY